MHAHPSKVILKFKKEVKINIIESNTFISSNIKNTCNGDEEYEIKSRPIALANIILEIPKDQKFIVPGGCVVIPAGSNNFTKVYLLNSGSNIEPHNKGMLDHRDFHVGDPDL